MKFTKFVLPILASLAFASPIENEKSLSKRASKQFYIPLELRNNNFDNSSSNWSYARSKSSEDFIVFWEPGFGTNPSTAPNNLRFDVDDLLSKAEKFFDYYAHTLKFVDGQSQTDKYKISIWIKYQTEWLATGSGYDNVVGALWVNPSTIQPVGGTIAHEIGHSFQYQVHCDGKYGFRDQDYVGTFWEICAQWMASRLYPEMFSNTEFELIPKNCWKHPLHENFRYQSILMEEYWSEKHGIDIVGKVWNGAKDKDDPIEAYKRVTNINQNQFIDEMFKVAQKNVLFDYKHLKSILKRFRSFYNIKLQQNSDGTYQIPVDQCTQSYGYVPVQLEIPSGGKVTVKFTGITGDSRYHTQYDKYAGWRYGFVAVKSDGETADYSAAAVGTTKESTITYTVPSGTKALWFVVMGAPTEHIKHHWKEGDNSGDEHFPWKVALSTCVKGTSCNPIKVDTSAPGIEGNQSNATSNTGNNNSGNNNSSSNNNNKTCFSTPLGYPCCKSTSTVVATDCDGKWGVENGQWCGIGGSPVSVANCWAKSLGYNCCVSKCGEVYATDANGKWSVENNAWCGIPN